MKNLMKEAHKLTKEIKAEYPNVDYKAQLGICISYLSKNEGEVKMVELKGSEKQVAWAEKSRASMINDANKLLQYVAENKKDNKATSLLERYENNAKNLLARIEIESDVKFFINNDGCKAKHFGKWN